MSRAIQDLAPGIAPKLNLLGDWVCLTLAAFIATESPDHSIRWGSGHAIGVIGVAAWTLAARALHQYDPNKRQGLLGDLALTSVLVGITSLVMVLPGVLFPAHMPPVTVSHLLTILWPSALWLRVVIPGVRAPMERPVTATRVRSTLGSVSAWSMARDTSQARSPSSSQPEGSSPCRIAGWATFPTEGASPLGRSV